MSHLIYPVTKTQRARQSAPSLLVEGLFSVSFEYVYGALIVCIQLGNLVASDHDRDMRLLLLYIRPISHRQIYTQPGYDFRLLSPAIIFYSIMCADVHRRTEEQVSETTRPCDIVREMVN